MRPFAHGPGPHPGASQFGGPPPQAAGTTRARQPSAEFPPARSSNKPGRCVLWLGAFSAFHTERAQGLVVHRDAFMGTHAKTLASFALRHRLATISDLPQLAAQGGLMSYGYSIPTSSGRRRPTSSTRSCAVSRSARSLSSKRPRSGSSSISRPPRRSASRSRRRCWRRRIRSSSNRWWNSTCAAVASAPRSPPCSCATTRRSCGLSTAGSARGQASASSWWA